MKVIDIILIKTIEHDIGITCNKAFKDIISISLQV